MKYGRLVAVDITGDKLNEQQEINVGDLFECLIIDRLYQSMNIGDIKDCHYHEIKTYDGEYIVLPINFYCHTLDFSSRIIPVFLGITVASTYKFTETEFNYLRRFSPIGCRDEKILRKLLNNGIDAYLNGCLVATLPKRQLLPTQNKVFFVEAQQGIKQYVPKKLFENCVFFNHEVFASPKELDPDGNLLRYANNVIEMYRKEARLIITSRYHAAIVALALGIPVILTMENNFYKYTWIQKYIPIYTFEQFDKINWDPPIVLISDEEKELMKQIACRRIQDTYFKYHDICKLSEARESVHITDFKDIFYGAYAIDYINQYWEKNVSLEYAFWGATQTAKELYSYISENFPNVRLKKIYDIFLDAKFLGLIPEKPSHIKSDDNLFIFVTGNSAVNEAKKKFKEIGKKRDQYFLCERKFLTKEDL